MPQQTTTQLPTLTDQETMERMFRIIHEMNDLCLHGSFFGASDLYVKDARDRMDRAAASHYTQMRAAKAA